MRLPANCTTSNVTASAHHVIIVRDAWQDCSTVAMTSSKSANRRGTFSHRSTKKTAFLTYSNVLSTSSLRTLSDERKVHNTKGLIHAYNFASKFSAMFTRDIVATISRVNIVAVQQSGSLHVPSTCDIVTMSTISLVLETCIGFRFTHICV